jgi:VanZ family protein
MDKFAHAAEYGVFAILLFRAFFWPQYKGLRKEDLNRSALLILLISGLYGLSDEIHQMYVPGRAATFPDWLADFAGSGLAVALCLFLTYPRQREKSSPPLPLS